MASSYVRGVALSAHMDGRARAPDERAEAKTGYETSESLRARLLAPRSGTPPRRAAAEQCEANR